MARHIGKKKSKTNIKNRARPTKPIMICHVTQRLAASPSVRSPRPLRSSIMLMTHLARQTPEPVWSRIHPSRQESNLDAAGSPGNRPGGDHVGIDCSVVG